MKGQAKFLLMSCTKVININKQQGEKYRKYIPTSWQIF